MGQYNSKNEHLFSYYRREKHDEGGLGGGSVAKIKLEVAKDFISSLVTFLGYVEQEARIMKEVYLLGSGKIFCDR